MKRSEINALIRDSETFFRNMQFALPPWGYWDLSQWRGRADDTREIVDNMLGWDLTDFGGNDFCRKGLILFTLRNGNPKRQNPKIYAEKIMIVRENQETPMHFHWKKMEDIINRGGGNLVIELYAADTQEKLSDTPLNVQIDGITRTIQPGGTVVLAPGESICLEPYMYHRFFGEPGKGMVLVGEVSSVNDDTTDNRFLELQGRFPEIIEDQEPRRLLGTDYAKYL